jgi:four helix bundle protein
MGSITSFEDLECWKNARELVCLVYSISNDGQLSRDFGLRDQLRRAAVSTMNNIAEGFGRDSNPQFIRFLDISQSSCMEVKSMTYILEDLALASPDSIQLIRKKAEETKGRVRRLSQYLHTHSKPN